MADKDIAECDTLEDALALMTDGEKEAALCELIADGVFA